MSLKDKQDKTLEEIFG